MKRLFFLVLISALLPSAFAAEEDEDIKVETSPAAGSGNQPKIIYRKRTAVSFDDAVVEGTANNPEGVYVVTPPDKQFGSLLKLRPNFHRELMRDALLLK